MFSSFQTLSRLIYFSKYILKKYTLKTEVYSKPCQTSKMKIFAESSISDVWQGSEYTSANIFWISNSWSKFQINSKWLGPLYKEYLCPHKALSMILPRRLHYFGWSQQKFQFKNEWNLFSISDYVPPWCSGYHHWKTRVTAFSRVRT